MSAEDLFTEDLWRSVLRDLRGSAAAWFQEHQETFSNLTRDEVLAIGHQLKAGDTTNAKLVLAGRMSSGELADYMRGTTASLEGIAARRAKALDAIEDLGRRAARLIGTAIVDTLL
jgi:hypothetical protein